MDHGNAMRAILPDVAQLELVDRTWIAVPARRVAAVVADPANWARWWPTLGLTLVADRGVEGLRWSVRSTEDQVLGTMEVWLQPMFDGVVVHYFLRLDPLPGIGRARRFDGRRARRLRLRHSVPTRRAFWALKDGLERPAPSARR